MTDDEKIRERIDHLQRPPLKNRPRPQAVPPPSPPPQPPPISGQINYLEPGARETCRRLDTLTCYVGWLLVIELLRFVLTFFAL